MDYVKLYTTAHDDPKMLGLSDKAFRAYVSALSWSGRHETDGDVTGFVPVKLTDELIAAGLMDDANTIHNWGKRQWTKAQMDAKRKAGRNAASKRWASDTQSQPHSQPHRELHTGPNTEVEVRGRGKREPLKPQPTAANAEAPVENLAVSDRVPHFLRKLTASDGRWGSVTPGAVVALAKRFDMDAVTTALSFAAVDPPSLTGSAYGWLEATSRGLFDAKAGAA